MKHLASKLNLNLIDYQSDNMTPVAFDPCRPIHFVVRNQNEPLGADPILLVAINRISQATGLQFINDGSTQEAPSFRRNNFQPTVYGDRWAPVLITPAKPHRAQVVYIVILHELGHLIGLAHVIDPGQLMFPEAGHGPTDLAAGDLTGATILGKGVCAPYL